MGLITETNAQYYSGQQVFTDVTGSTIVTTFNTDLVGTVANVSNANFSVTKNGSTLTEGVDYTLASVKLNQINFTNPLVATDQVVVTLIQPAINANYGSYEYVSLTDIVNNFMVAYVGMDKLIPRVKRSDVIFTLREVYKSFHMTLLNLLNLKS